MLPERYAYDFLLFCQRNPKPCPLLDVSEAGGAESATLAPGADLYSDVPQYRIFVDGQLTEEVADVRHLRGQGMVSFLLGCSFSFEAALIAAGVPVRHLQEETAAPAAFGSGGGNSHTKNVPMFRTSVPCRAAGVFSGPLVVSMRPMTPEQAIRAIQITSRFPSVHGSPVHVGDPAHLGIQDVSKPHWGDAVRIEPGEVPVFWACGVTPQAAIVTAKPSLAVTHSPGCMFVSDVLNCDLAALP